MEESKSYEPLQAPYEDESKTYIKSFLISCSSEIRSFFLKYGFVVVSDVLTTEECLQSIVEVYQDLKDNSFGKFDPTLENYDKVDQFVKRFGLVGGGHAVILPQSVHNRQNENIYKAYKFATGNDFFLSAFERYGFMVPTKKAPEIETIKNWLHIDYNPLTGKTSTFGYLPSELHNKLNHKNPLVWQNAYFQGIVALDDCPMEVGGFHCVPGFHVFCEEWKNQNENHCLNSARGHDPTTVQIPKDDEVRKFIQKMPIRKGSILIWDGRMAHGNFPNSSDKPRLLQYIKYNAVGQNISSNVCSLMTSSEEELEVLKKIGITELGKKLFGLEKWFPEQVIKENNVGDN